MDERFRRVARAAEFVVGAPWTFLALVLCTGLWMVGGFAFGFTSDYQLYYNTAVSALTLWLVALLQNSQTSSTQAVQLKLDELLRAHGRARTGLVDLESMSAQDLQRLQEQFARLRLESQERPQRQREGESPMTDDGTDPTADPTADDGTTDPATLQPGPAGEPAEPAEPAEDMVLPGEPAPSPLPGGADGADEGTGEE